MTTSEELVDSVQNESLSVRYSTTEEDVVRYNLFHFQHTKQGRKYLNNIRIRWIVLVATMLFLYAFFITQLIPIVATLWLPLLLPVLGTPLSYLLMLKRYPQAVRKMVKKLYLKGENKALFCEHLLVTSASGILSKSDYSETKFAWGALERIETEPDYTYLYFGSLQAIIIPHMSIVEGNLPGFLNSIKTHYKPGQLLESAERTAI